MKKILILCGAGIATSTVIKNKVEEHLNKENIEYNISQSTLSGIHQEAKDKDLIISSMNIEEDYGVPVIVGTAFITGIGEEEVKNEIVDVLTSQ